MESVGRRRRLKPRASEGGATKHKPGHQMTNPTFKRIEHQWIPMPDGVRLSARLWLPHSTQSKPAPAILEYIPYRKSDMVRIRDERNHDYFAQCGYACLRVDMRGSGDSEGIMSDMYEPAELDDAIEVINWISQQPWCNGSVGMMGTSWGGTASLQAASRRPEALKTIIAVCANNNRFEDDIHHMGGYVLTDTVEWGATLPAILASPPNPDTVGDGWREMWMQRLENLAFPLENWIKHETRNDYWRFGSVDENPDAIECPVLMVGGWSDRYSNTVMNFLTQSHEQSWGIVGPWGHHYPNMASPGPGIGFQQEAVRWWDHWLKGEDNGIDREPKLRVWMQDFNEPQDKIEQRAGRWISEPTWPSQNCVTRRFYCDDDALTETPNKQSSYKTVPATLCVGRASGDTGYFGRPGGLPLDQREDDEHSLVFTSAPLEEAVELLGRVRLRISLSSNEAVGVLAARLVDVTPNGDAARVSYAIRNLALNDELAEPSNLRANEMQTCAIDFHNTAYRFEKGHRIRLSLSSNYWPLVWPAARMAAFKVSLADTVLELLIRRDTSSQVVKFEIADPSLEPKTYETISSAPLQRSISDNAETNTRTMSWDQPFSSVRLKDIDMDFGYETHAYHRIALDEPNSAVTEYEHKLCYRHADWAVEVVGRAALSCDEFTYRLIGSVTVIENGEVVFSREWKPADSAVKKRIVG